ncbi:formate dehydrogenase accessory sulfurtransferase FdhD [Methanobrevibacter sp. DSM 116169]|uniref:formate dehydrogenase accessory sulfurtransferase FdhD n=1 Tax=Methanobrevibacter sp. DSM 116169 TaxID=3242727 RepID=UPI0038FCD3DB
MKLIKKVDALKFRSGKINEIKEDVVSDNPITLVINGKRVSTFSAIKDSLKEFSIGYLLGENIIKSLEEIEDIDIDENIINIKLINDYKIEDKQLCSDAAGGLREKVKSADNIESNLKISSEELVKNMELLTSKAKIWKLTGGTHVAALVYNNKIILREDVSRHVAVDKVIGAGALEEVDFNQSYIIYSGRMPADMVIKLNRVGIPIIASNAAPAYSGYLVVKESNMTMIGFLRGENFNVYGNYERIAFN